MPTLSAKADPRWDAARDEHRVALAAYLDAAERMPQAAWTQPWSPGKWTPAQITEHLALAYEAGVTEIRGGPAMQLKMTPARRAVFRW
ncbi:MAG TPA: DinB family protein, partial [Longimicrobiaceae bacterium]|nr:DinB family protein [Longimicrobiaceae bacterium]